MTGPSEPLDVLRYYHTFVPKEKVTLTLDSNRLAELRARVGGRSLSAAVDAALAAHLDRLAHLAAVDEWMAELECEHGPVPTETLEWAARIVDEWADGRTTGSQPLPG